MYRPLLLAAWYSSAGMVRNLSVFMGVSFWFSRRPPFVGAYPLHSGFFSKRQDDSAKILEFRAKKRQDRKKAVWRENKRVLSNGVYAAIILCIYEATRWLE